MTSWSKRLVALFAMLALVASACGDDDDVATVSQAPEDAPTVVVTTNILGDVVQNIAGDQLQVVTLMPVGADPHDFQASAQQVAQIGDADVLIVNGESFEEGLLDVIESAEGDGVSVYAAISTVSTIEFGEGGHDHGHDDEHEHADEDHEHEDEDHEHEGEDGEHKDDEHADEDHEHEDEDHEHEGEDGEHKDDEHADEDHEHEDEDHEHEGEDGEHKDDEHADEDHEHEGEDHEHEGEDGEHKDDEHADEDHEHEGARG